MSCLEKVKEYVKEFENSNDDEKYFAIPKEEVEEMMIWLTDYISHEENYWLWYDFKKISNFPGYCVLILSAKS